MAKMNPKTPTKVVKTPAQASNPGRRGKSVGKQVPSFQTTNK